MYLIQQNEFGTVSVWKEDFLKWLPLLWVLTTTWRNSDSLPQGTASSEPPHVRRAPVALWVSFLSRSTPPPAPKWDSFLQRFLALSLPLAAVAVAVAFGREVASVSDRQRWTEVA